MRLSAATIGFACAHGTSPVNSSIEHRPERVESARSSRSSPPRPARAPCTRACRRAPPASRAGARLREGARDAEVGDDRRGRPCATSTLSGLRSRWTTPAAWARREARADAAAIAHDPRDGERPSRSSSAPSDSPSTSSIVRNLLALVLADVEDARHVAVGDAARELHLAAEALEDASGVRRAPCAAP